MTPDHSKERMRKSTLDSRKTSTTAPGDDSKTRSGRPNSRGSEVNRHTVDQEEYGGEAGEPRSGEDKESRKTG